MKTKIIWTKVREDIIEGKFNGRVLFEILSFDNVPSLPSPTLKIYGMVMTAGIQAECKTIKGAKIKAHHILKAHIKSLKSELELFVPKEEYFIVQYNDCYGNGDQKQYEGVMTRPGFETWLVEHNERRWNEVACGEKDSEDHLNKKCCCFENEDEFDLIPTTIIK